ncbi:amidohydrolase [Planifilum fimeticola]|uniref:Amidohydrolase n=1 Tax=Planifilum fimeticola TaxID=201975 RepID=A0A2T0LJQ1_9BACL|nr:amidohydrolase [Planifilum fimeticola]
MDRLSERIEKIFSQMVEWRRRFHMEPELSFREERTPARVAEILRECGIDVRTGVGGRGVVGTLTGGRPGKTVALRADMDALPIQDEKDCEYRSRVPGVMHACGHDGHMAVLLGVARLLSEMREEIPGRVRFLFQHAEEVIPGGAREMIEDGALDGVDAVYGVHLWTPLPVGVVGIKAGPLMAAADSFQIDIFGKGGHGGLPHESVDAIVVASHLIVHLQTLISRQVDPLKSAVISVGTIQGGQGFNVIAERCTLTGTVRTFDPVLREQMHQRIREIAENSCSLYGATCRVDYQWGYPAVVNDTVEAHRVAGVARRLVGDDRVWELQPVMAAEDFAYYLGKVPGAFCFVGAGNPEKNCDFPHHHPRFDFDERAMKVAARLLLSSALAYLRGEGRREKADEPAC